MPLSVAPVRAEASGSSHVTVRVRTGTADATDWTIWCICNSVSSRLDAIGSGARAGPRPRAHVVRIDRPAAMRAGDDRIKYLAAVAMLEQHRPPAFAGHMGVAPAHEREQHRLQVEALGREPILVAARALLIGHAAQHAERDELAQPVGEHVPG